MKPLALLALACVAVGGWAQAFPFEREADRAPKLKTNRNCLIRGAKVFTITKGVIENGDVLVREGKIVEIGRNLTLPSGFTEIDGRGKILMPGIVDTHVHRGLDGTNEGSESITPEASVRWAINPESKTIWQALASGHTTGLLLHGSANPVGGESVVIKYKYRYPVAQLPVPSAPRQVKFALGENVTRKNSPQTANSTQRFPRSRMGVEATYRRAFEEAKVYRAKQKRGEKIRRDVRLETLADILDGKVWVQCHSYRADEMLMMVRLSQEFNFRLNMQHALEAYKIAPEMAAANVSCGMFFDNWASKIEMYDGNPYNAAICHAAGVLVSVNTDGTSGTTALNIDAGKAMRFGGVSEEDALKMLTINGAKTIGIDKVAGSIEVGKDADLVLWDGHPLSVYSKPVLTMVEGDVLFQRRDAFKIDAHSVIKSTLDSYAYQPAPERLRRAQAYAITNAAIYPVSGQVIQNGTVIIEGGKITAVGERVSIPANAVRVDGTGRRVYPGFIDGGATIGLSEVSGITQWNDGSEYGDYQPDMSARTALFVESAYYGTAIANGVLHSLSKPTGGVIPGRAALIQHSGYTTEQLGRYPDQALVLNLPFSFSFRGEDMGITTMCCSYDSWADIGLAWLDGVLPPPGAHQHDDDEHEHVYAVQPAQAQAGQQTIQTYLDEAKKYLANPTSPRNLRLEALRPYLEGKRPVVIRTRTASSIRNAVDFAKKYGLKVILSGADEAWKEAKLLKENNIPVLISPAGKVVLGANIPTNDWDPYDSPYIHASLLAKEGVLFGFESGSNSEVQNLPIRVGQSCAYGLSYEDALKALTINPAKIFGVEDRIGSIEQGKMANLIITDGDPLDTQCNVLYAFVEGEPASLESKHTRLRDKYWGRFGR